VVILGNQILVNQETNLYLEVFELPTELAFNAMGKVKGFDDTQGYGFIVPDPYCRPPDLKGDIFVPRSELNEEVQEGDKVAFHCQLVTEGRHAGKYQACNVTKTSQQGDQEEPLDRHGILQLDRPFNSRQTGDNARGNSRKNGKKNARQLEGVFSGTIQRRDEKDNCLILLNPAEHPRIRQFYLTVNADPEDLNCLEGGRVEVRLPYYHVPEETNWSKGTLVEFELASTPDKGFQALHPRQKEKTAMSQAFAHAGVG
jgi:cold shock CspA family protein